MNKRFGHFMSYWQQFMQPQPPVKRTREDQRVARAKARLRHALSTR
jgi:hypothetical protein